MNAFFRNISLVVAAIGVTLPISAYHFEENGIYYNIIDTERSKVEVTYGNIDESMPYNFYYSGIISLPQKVVHDGIEYEVCRIGEKAFVVCINVSYLSIPNTVTEIGANAFRMCNGLKTVTIPGSVTEIDDDAFYGCAGLEKVILENGVRSIGNEVFRDCAMLKEVTIPESIDNIGYGIVVNSGDVILSIDKNNNKYHMDGIFLMDDSGTVVSVMPSASGEVSLPFGTLHLMRNAFENNKGIWKVHFGNAQGVDSIPESCFAGMYNLMSMDLPDNVESIGDDAFAYCKTLSWVMMKEGCIKIGDRAFKGCSELWKVELPRSLSVLGQEAYYGCNNLSSLVIPDGTKLKKIEKNAFYGCTELQSVTIPEGIKAICENAFYGCGISELALPESMELIDDYAFYENKIKCFEVKGKIQHIGKRAFSLNNPTDIIIRRECTICDEAFLSESGMNVWIYTDVPPVIGSRSFESAWKELSPSTIHVKKGLKSLYEGIEYWNEYEIVDDLLDSEYVRFERDCYEIGINDIGKAELVCSEGVKILEVRWESEDENIVFVDYRTGQFIGIAAGNTVIRSVGRYKFQGEIHEMYIEADVNVIDKTSVELINGDKTRREISISGIDGILGNGIHVIVKEDGKAYKILHE